MSVLKHDIENVVGSKCMCNCVHGNHAITFTDCYYAIKKLKVSKSYGCTGILSNHIIHAGERLACYLALLFTSMLRHGSSPDDMLLGTMIPLPKGKWINLSCSDKARITEPSLSVVFLASC